MGRPSQTPLQAPHRASVFDIISVQISPPEAHERLASLQASANHGDATADRTGGTMPTKKSAKQMRLFAFKTERKHKRRDRSGPLSRTARRAQPEASRPTDAEPEQLDLIAHLEKSGSPT